MKQGVHGARCFFNVSKQGERQTARLERLAEVAENALPEGAELVEARFSGGPLLTLFVDRVDGPVDHEVCSPGIDRPLTKPAHFSRFVGHEAKVRTAEPMVGGLHDGRRNFTGTIERADETSFVLKLPEGGAEVELPFGSVSKAHLKEDI